MIDLTEFLLARIAEDEAVASHGDGGLLDGGAHWNRARVLAECEAKRRIVEDHGDQHDCTSLTAGDWPYIGCTTLRLLALPYADHADWREEWRP